MKKLIYLLTGAILLVSCSQEEFNIENTNAADAARVLANANDFQNFNITNHTALAQSQLSFNGIYFRGLSDQMTTTNAFSGFWSSTDQPRRQINNSTTNDDLSSYPGGTWNDFNNVINNSNIVINNIENDGNSVVINDEDKTNQELAAAYFDKGIGQGYLSMIFDKAYIVNPDTNVNALEFSTYSEVLEAALSNIQTAIDLANGENDFNYTLYTGGNTYSGEEFIKIAYSYMARFAIAEARTDSEAQTLDYNKILNFANQGITTDFSPISDEDKLVNVLQDWSLFVLGDTSGYMPTDIKIQHLFDPSYPTDYPLDESVVLGEVDTDDPRISYYEYVGANFGFLRASRGRQLFSSYKHVRFFNDNNEFQTGLSLQIFPKAELDYIKAEAYLRLNDVSSAVAALDASPRLTVGGQTTGANAASVRAALLYENSIELDLNSGLAVEWAFMRRHDLLLAGTPTMFPIPASELEITQDEIYTFGGEANAGQPGTASGANDWRNLVLDYDGDGVED